MLLLLSLIWFAGLGCAKNVTKRNIVRKTQSLTVGLNLRKDQDIQARKGNVGCAVENLSSKNGNTQHFIGAKNAETNHHTKTLRATKQSERGFQGFEMRTTYSYCMPHYEYCHFCKIHHLRWKWHLFEYEDSFVIDKKLLSVTVKSIGLGDVLNLEKKSNKTT